MAEITVTTKTCSKCKAEKPAAEFSADKRMASGLKSNCRVCGRAVALAWKERNREHTRNYAREYAKSHPEDCRARDRLRNIRHPGRNTERSKVWWASHPEEAKAIGLRQKAKRRAAFSVSDFKVTKDDLVRIRTMQGDKCAACAIKLLAKGHFDHIQPLSRAGLHKASNLQLLCQTCNLRKHARDPIDFMRMMGRLL